MNEILAKNSFFIRVKSYLLNNKKLFIGGFLLLLFLLFLIQFLTIYNNNKVFKTSIIYNDIKANVNNFDFQNQFNNLSKEKNFYGTLATLELIKIDLNNSKLEPALESYLKLLNDSKLNNIYKAAIAVHGSHLLLDKIFDNQLIVKKNYKFIIENINKLISYIDPELKSYEGLKMEISFLIAIILNDINSLHEEEVDNLYKQVQSLDTVSSNLKERVKKIYEFQKYQ